jgi:hypothetical protein
LPVSLLEQPLKITDVATGLPVDYQIRTIDDPLRPYPHSASRYGLSQVSQNSQGGLNWQKNQVMDLMFLAENVPALGYKLFKIKALEEEQAREEIQMEKELTVLENDFYRISFDKSRPMLQVYDKELGREIFNANENAYAGQLLVKSMAQGDITSATVSGVEIIEEGPVYSIISLQSEAKNCPEIRQEITLHHQVKRIDFAIRFLKNVSPNHE